MSGALYPSESVYPGEPTYPKAPPADLGTFYPSPLLYPSPSIYPEAPSSASGPPVPVLGPSWADDFVERIAPWYTSDWEDWLRAIAAMWAQLEFYVDDVRDDDGNVLTPGWSRMLDPDNCEIKGLPYLGQYVGERLPKGLDDVSARKWVKDAPNQWRGTPYSIIKAAQRWLTGSRMVQFRERSKLDGTDNPRWIAVQTYTHETPNAALVLAEMRKTCPAWIGIDYQTVEAATWADIKANFDTWADVKANFATWADVLSSSAGFISYQ